MSSKIIALLLLLSSSSLAYSQGIKTKIRQGNKLYKEKNFSEAETAYRKALLLDSLSGKANFGVSAAAYELGRYKEAASYLERALRDPRISTKEAAATLHNLGNVAMKDKKYEEAIRLYEESLITHPESDDTRYNLALAQRLLKQQQQNQQGGGGNNQNQDKDKQDKQKQNPKQDQQQNKDKDKQDPKQNDNQEGTPKEQQNGQMSQEQAKQILDAFRSDDEQTRRRVEQRQREQKQQQNSTKNKKRW